MPTESLPKPPSDQGATVSAPLFHLVILGAWRFALVSVGAFSVWALGGKWFAPRGGEPMMYAAIAAVFIGLSGLLLHPLTPGPRPIRSFYWAFAPAFFAYAFVWSGCWFWLGFGRGEWLGAVGGGIAFVALSAWHFGNWRGFGIALAGFLVLHTLGYYSGGWAMGKLIGIARSGQTGFLAKSQWVTLAKLSWGLAYGLGFGAGMAWVFGVLRGPLITRR